MKNDDDNNDLSSATGYCVGTDFELLSLGILSSSLESLVGPSQNDYSDADIEVEGIAVGVLRGILDARSPFFHELFTSDQEEKDVSDKKGQKRPKYLLSELVPYRIVGYEAFMVVLNYLYTGKFRPPPPEVSTCVDESCTHDACVPAVTFAVEIMCACATFQIKELVMVVERRLINFVNKIFVEEVIQILQLAYHFDLKSLLSSCVQRIARVDVDDVIIEKALTPDVVSDIRSVRADRSKFEKVIEPPLMNFLRGKTMTRILRALDSNDVELLKLLIEESNMSLDDTCVLHYAAAFCSPKIFDEVKKLGAANVNRRNSRGYTVLHIAVRRKDPSIALRVLELGGSVFEATLDGRTAVMIRRRLTRPKDFNESMEHGKETNMDRLCIDVLEREMCRKPLAREISMSAMMVANDMYTRLLLLENRVAMARSLFPVEARLSMHIAQADSTSEFAGLSAYKDLYGNLREIDLNALPSEQVKKLQQRSQALQKAVEANHRFFPNCSEILDRLVEDDTLGDLLLKEGSPEEQKKKRMRYMELKADLMDAFDKDMSENKSAGVVLCSLSLKRNGMRKVKKSVSGR